HGKGPKFHGTSALGGSHRHCRCLSYPYAERPIGTVWSFRSRRGLRPGLCHPVSSQLARCSRSAAPHWTRVGSFARSRSTFAAVGPLRARDRDLSALANLRVAELDKFLETAPCNR